jgi:hypothetical protein
MPLQPMLTMETWARIDAAAQCGDSGGRPLLVPLADQLPGGLAGAGFVAFGVGAGGGQELVLDRLDRHASDG